MNNAKSRERWPPWGTPAVAPIITDLIPWTSTVCLWTQINDWNQDNNDSPNQELSKTFISNVWST